MFAHKSSQGRSISQRVFDADASNEKKKPEEGENTVEEDPADTPSLLELKRIYYELVMQCVQWAIPSPH